MELDLFAGPYLDLFLAFSFSFWSLILWEKYSGVCICIIVDLWVDHLGNRWYAAVASLASVLLSLLFSFVIYSSVPSCSGYVGWGL